jgi:hypothetical protein
MTHYWRPANLQGSIVFNKKKQFHLNKVTFDFTPLLEIRRNMLQDR